MAKIVTLQILVDDDESHIADGLNEMLRTAAQPVDPDDADARSWIIDWRLAWGSGQMLLQPVPDEVADAICNDTYTEGDAFHQGLCWRDIPDDLTQTEDRADRMATLPAYFRQAANSREKKLL
jgi:hypothetical protein